MNEKINAVKSSIDERQPTTQVLLLRPSFDFPPGKKLFVGLDAPIDNWINLAWIPEVFAVLRL